ncbi:MAG: sulfatase [Verrucomicrobia bacterium]|nr:sulfatase [Verrucomicrobiota bacterium]
MRLTAHLLLAVAAALPVSGVGAARPNFLIIIADDLHWRDLGVTGSPDVKTPHLDRLASEGMNLRAFFTPAPTCSPLRHALYTGLFPIRSGAYPNHTMVDPATRSVFTHLNGAGYRTALLGKTHVSPESSFPFEHLGKGADDAEACGRFFRRDPAQPWLLVLASNDPHGPYTRGPREQYDPARITVPSYLHDNAVTRRHLAGYFAEITALDAQVGACLAALDAAGQREQTLVLFLSEQGSGFPYGGKWSLYDNGIRAAAFARWPGRIRPGTASDALMQYVDVAPTLLAAAGLDPAAIDTGCPDARGFRGFDGRSFLDVLLGRADRLRDVVFAQHTTVGRVRPAHHRRHQRLPPTLPDPRRPRRALQVHPQPGAREQLPHRRSPRRRGDRLLARGRPIQSRARRAHRVAAPPSRRGVVRPAGGPGGDAEPRRRPGAGRVPRAPPRRARRLDGAAGRPRSGDRTARAHPPAPQSRQVRRRARAQGPRQGQVLSFNLFP